MHLAVAIKELLCGSKWCVMQLLGTLNQAEAGPKLPVKRFGVIMHLTVACILPPAFPNLQGPSARDSRTPFGGHSAPGNVPIFLLHSAQLI